MSRTSAVLLGLIVLVVSLHFARAQDRAASQPVKVQPVDFHKLQELMPADVAGVTRSDLGGDNITAGEMVISRANADYTKPDSDGTDPHASIEITDYGASRQMVAGLTAWRTVPINIENDQGYTRTVKLKDYPAMEVYTKDGDSRQLVLLVAERFLISIETTHLPEADFKKLIQDLPLAKLATLK